MPLPEGVKNSNPLNTSLKKLSVGSQRAQYRHSFRLNILKYPIKH